ncbi:hypothetical protein N658DRAFT_562571 [Parathielavia hyrcaniae]|uniref:Uncharacterized protein n=1 Tax=Parathielavia hyrcaniae TaxID=113614 RepID=A0AAN6SX40_9PEZI|nr:hypothetical protein N658DRAFT_562571 [Parathielavia hyrcaniae]
MIIFTNCTLPSHDRGFVASPNVRSTINIVWTCIATLLLCCWSILHLKVPQVLPGSWLFWRKVKWLSISILALEAIFAKAATEFVSARVNTRLIRQAFAEKDGVKWTQSHSFLADMGGFAIRFGQDLPTAAPSYAVDATTVSGTADASKDQDCDDQESTAVDNMKLHTAVRTPNVVANIFLSTTRTVSSVLASALFGLEDDMQSPSRLFWKCGEILTRLHKANAKAVGEYYERNPTALMEAQLHVLEFDTWTLTARQLYEARNIGLICHLPHVTEDDILDRSKDDLLVKVLASLQIAWLGSPGPRSPRTCAPSRIRPRHFGMHKDIDEYSVPNNAINSASCEWFDHEWAEIAYMACLYGGSAMFCGLHILAWDFPFPTAADQVIWRVATLDAYRSTWTSNMPHMS